MRPAPGFACALAFLHRATSLYREDEPNVFAEPAVLARELLPILLQLLERAPAGSPLHASALRWLAATGPSILHDLQYCRHRWSQGGAQREAPRTGRLVSSSPGPCVPGGDPATLTAPLPTLSAGTAARWGIKALGCAKLHRAVAVLLVRARLVVQVLHVLGESATTVPGLGCNAQELEQELMLVQGLLVQHGLAPVPSQNNVPREAGPPSGAA